MIGWLNTAQAMLRPSPRRLRPSRPGGSGGFSWYLFGSENRLQYDIAGTLGNGSWGYIVGIYEKDAGLNNQRLYFNGARIAQTSDTLPLDLNSNPPGIGRHVSGVADPFNGHTTSSASPTHSIPAGSRGRRADLPQGNFETTGRDPTRTLTRKLRDGRRANHQEGESRERKSESSTEPRYTLERSPILRLALRPNAGTRLDAYTATAYARFVGY
jgi:hypothetical protein